MYNTHLTGEGWSVQHTLQVRGGAYNTHLTSEGWNTTRTLQVRGGFDGTRGNNIMLHLR